MSSTVFQPTGYGLETFMARYALHPEETWEEACRRIANSISAAENGGRIEWEEKFYNELVSNRFIPGGRIIYGCGRAKAAMINCFVIGGEDMDSREGWGKYLSQMLVISGLGGGVGINCIKGSEKVITDRGLFEAKDLAGEVHNVLASDGVFRPAMWSSYGEQELFKVTFSNGDVVYCTEDHDWITVAPKGKRVRTKTKNLVGHTVPVVSATDFSYEDGGTESYLEGVRNGLVFGDGTIRTDRDYPMFLNSVRTSILWRGILRPIPSVSMLVGLEEKPPSLLLCLLTTKRFLVPKAKVSITFVGSWLES